MFFFLELKEKGEMKGRCESQAAFGAAVSLETREIHGERCAGLRGWMQLTLNCMA